MFYLKGAYLNNQPRRNSLSFNKVEKAGRELHPFLQVDTLAPCMFYFIC